MIFLSSYSSKLESDIRNESRTPILSKSQTIVDPKIASIINKTVIFTIPTDLDLDRLLRFNKLKSRFPINEKIELEPYEINEDRKDVNIEMYSTIILNEYMISSEFDNYNVAGGEYLLGLNESINGYLTSVGYKINKNNLNKFKQN